jgi:hypothetical protein
MGDVSSIHPDRKNNSKETIKMLAKLLAVYAIPAFILWAFY